MGILGKARDLLRSIPQGVRNLSDWFGVVWADRDWDHSFLYRVLRHKLYRMERLQREHGQSVNSGQVADRIRVCILLLDRLIGDEYLSNAMGPHDRRWGESRMVFTPLNDREGYSSMTLEVDGVSTDEERLRESRERTALYKHSDYMEKQDLDMLFDCMRRHVQGWWD